MTLRIVPDEHRTPSPLFQTAVALTKAQADQWRRQIAEAPPRELWTVEALTERGWIPCPGDSYIERSDADEVAGQSEKRRVVRYVPEREP